MYIFIKFYCFEILFTQYWYLAKIILIVLFSITETDIVHEFCSIDDQYLLLDGNILHNLLVIWNVLQKPKKTPEV